MLPQVAQSGGINTPTTVGDQMSDTFQPGEFIRTTKDYSWGNGKFAGDVLQITDVHDHRELLDDADALIYSAQKLDSRDGSTLMVEIPVAPEDIDETYDHYEAQRAADFSGFLAKVIA